MDQESEQQQQCVIEENQEGRNIIFGKFEMGRLLGKGTFAKVYYGKNLTTNESVAIKVINKEQLKKAGTMDQIKREISIMKLVRHPNIVQLKEVMATKGKIFVVMEYVKGGELFAKVAKGKLSEDLARKYFQQLIGAIDFCHSRGVSHRDLKPENLLLDEDENLKVSDFGLSALPAHLRQDGLLHTQCGTPSYVAPEVLRHKGYDGAKADIWSCGVVLFVLLAGSLPFHHENVMRMYRKVLKAQYEIPAWFSDEAKQLVSRLLVTDPNQRLSIADIVKEPWFLLPGPAVTGSKDDDDDQSFGLISAKASSSPRFYNAFELISSMSSGFDLSGMFEEEKNKQKGSLFTSKCSASAIMNKLELLANRLKFRVFSKEFKMKMRGEAEGRKGNLLVMAEVFEVAPELAVVEFSKSSGDTIEYLKFCQEDVRPALKDIVWSWQGENV